MSTTVGRLRGLELSAAAPNPTGVGKDARADESARIGRCLDRAEGGHGRALVVAGPAGIGKTTLLAAGCAAAEDTGFRVLRARGAELESEFPFGVVRQLVEPLVLRASEEGRADMLDGPPGGAARLLGLLPGSQDGVAATALVARDPSFAVLHGLYWLCAKLAAERPLALVVDDAHWADRASLRFLVFLLPRLEKLPAAVLLAAQPAEAGQRHELLAAIMMDPATEVITMAPLSPMDVARLVAGEFGVEPDPEFAAACWQATGGTPFVLRSLVDELKKEGIAPVTASAGKVQGIAPASLGRWAALRLARMGADAARLAQAVSVLERAELDQAARLAGLAAPECARAADLLVRAEVLQGAPLRFSHPLLRSAVYREISLPERSEAHGRAARLLAATHAGPGAVAEHLLATSPAGDGWVVGQLLSAARQAIASGTVASGVAYLRRALTEPPSPEAEPGVLLELGRAEFRAGHPDALNHLQAVVDGPGDATNRLAAALSLAHALKSQMRIAEAVAVCDGVAARSERLDRDARWRLEAMAIACGMLDADTAPSIAKRTNALVLETTLRPVPRQALAVAAYAAALSNRPADQVADLARRAMAVGSSALLEPGEPQWLSSAISALCWAERYSEAQALLDSTVSAALTGGNEMVLQSLRASRARLALRRGKLTTAEADARAVLEASGPSVPPMALFSAAGILVEVLVERGAYDLAERELQPFAAELQGTSHMTATLRYARARLLVAKRRFADALSDLHAVGAIAARTGAVSPSCLAWRSHAALAARAVGDSDTARRLSEEELELARSFGAPRTLGVALRAAGLVAGGRTGHGLLREAIDILAGPDTALEHAHALTDLGALLRRDNHRVAARPLLRQALDAAHHLGAAALGRQAETELRATGAKPRRMLLSGLEALTASERRIAELAAEGLSNREIAQALFVTARTVEGHLTHVYQKLDVTRRAALSAALATPAEAA